MSGPDYAAQAEAHRKLTKATMDRVVADARAEELLADQVNAVRECFAAGVSAAEIVRVTGLSRTRVYEMRDGR